MAKNKEVVKVEIRSWYPKWLVALVVKVGLIKDKIKNFSLRKYVVSKLLVKHKLKLSDLVVLNDGTKRNDYMEVQGLYYDHNYQPVIGLYDFNENRFYVVPESQYKKYTLPVEDLVVEESNG